MSGLRTPPDLSVDYDCLTCGAELWMSQSCLDLYECDGQSLHLMHPVNGKPTRCSACVRINEAVYTLDDLVLQKPFLTTGGMADAPEASSWEKVDEKKPFEYDDEEGSLGDGMSKEERQAFIDKIVQSFFDTAGQGLTEEEVYGEGAGQDGRQSQASTQVDECLSVAGSVWDDSKTETGEWNDSKVPGEKSELSVEGLWI